MKIVVVPGEYSVCRLPPGAMIALAKEGFSSVTSTADELSVVCLASHEPEGAKIEAGWSLLKIAGVLDFSLVGILSEISGVLARAKISLFAVSTFDTDYILVRDLPGAVSALRGAGHELP